MNFDPTKPVSDKTECGQFTVRNFRERATDGLPGDAASFPYVAEIISPDSNRKQSFTFNQYGRDYNVHPTVQLLNTPDPAPAVDLACPMRWKQDRVPFTIALELKQSNGTTEYATAYRDCHGNEVCEVYRLEDIHNLAENVPPEPPPPRTVTVEVAACEHDTTPAHHAIRWPCGRLLIVDEEGSCVDCHAPQTAVSGPGYNGYRFTSPWVSHEFVLPLNAKE